MLNVRRRIFKKSDDNLQILLFWRPQQEISNIRNQPFSRTEHFSTENKMELVEVVSACKWKLKQMFFSFSHFLFYLEELDVFSATLIQTIAKKQRNERYSKYLSGQKAKVSSPLSIVAVFSVLCISVWSLILALEAKYINATVDHSTRKCSQRKRTITYSTVNQQILYLIRFKERWIRKVGLSTFHKMFQADSSPQNREYKIISNYTRLKAGFFYWLKYYLFSSCGELNGFRPGKLPLLTFLRLLNAPSLNC